MAADNQTSALDGGRLLLGSSEVSFLDRLKGEDFSLGFFEGLQNLSVEVAAGVEQAWLIITAPGRGRNDVCAVQHPLQQGEIYQLRQPAYRLLLPHFSDH